MDIAVECDIHLRAAANFVEGIFEYVEKSLIKT